MSNAPSKPVSFSRPKVGYFSNRPRIGGWVGPRVDLNRRGNLAPTGIRSPDRPAPSELLYRLSYPGPSHTIDELKKDPPSDISSLRARAEENKHLSAVVLSAFGQEGNRQRLVSFHLNFHGLLSQRIFSRFLDRNSVHDVTLTDLRTAAYRSSRVENETHYIKKYRSLKYFDTFSILKLPLVYMSIHGIMAVPISSVRIYYVLSTCTGCSIRESHQYKEDRTGAQQN